MMAFLWAGVCYVIGFASWLTTAFLVVAEWICWLLAIALIYHAFNTI
jgi:hypothetical protein